MKYSRFALLGAVLAVACAFLVVDAGSASAAFHNAPILADLSLASLMVSPAALRARGIVRGVRADGDPTKILAELNTAFAALKDENDKRLKALEKGREDVVTNEKVDRINTSVGDLQKAIDELNQKTAALTVGGAGSTEQESAETKAYASAFRSWFKRGHGEQALGELAFKASLVTSSNPDGGYVVTPEMDREISRVLTTVSAMRSLATVRSIGTSTYEKLVKTSGATAGWVGEKDTRPETSTPKLSKLAFEAMELYANPFASQTLLDDSNIDIAAWLAEEVAIEFTEQEGDAFINGNGVAKPRGLLSYDTVANASYEWGKLGFTVTGAAADFAASNPSDALIRLVYSLKRAYRSNAAFLMNDLVLAKVRLFKDGQGNYLWQPSAQDGEPAKLLGYACDTDDNLPDVGANAFPVAFGDFRRGYVIVDRQGTRVLRDPYTNKPFVGFYTTKRVGGGVQNFEAIKLLKCSA